MHKYLSTPCQCELSVSFSSFFQRRSACFRAVPKPLTVFVHSSLISAYHRTHLFGRQTQSNSGIVLSYCVKYADWHKPPVFRAWSNSFNGLPTVHTKVWFCSTKWEQKSQTIYYAVCDSPHSLSSAIYFLPWGSASHFSPFFSGSPHPPAPPPPPRPLLTKLLPPAMVLEHHRELLHYAEAS